MYERFRSEIMTRLDDIMDRETLIGAMAAIDQVASRYEVKRAETELIVYDDGLPEIVKAYLVSRSIEGMSRKTLRCYQYKLACFLQTIGKGLTQVTTNDVRVWLFNYETERQVSKRTVEHTRGVLSGFFRWACAEGWLPSNPMETMKKIKYEAKPRVAMGQMDLEYIREACETDREKALVELLYSTGARISEVSTLKLSDVDWQRKEVLLFGKGAKYRKAYLNAKAIVALRRYLKKRGFESEAVIASDHAPHGAIGKSCLEEIIKRIAGRVSDKLSVPVTPHVFRHTTATTALQRGMPVQDVQQMLGHVNINTTMIYAKTSQTEVKDMHDKTII